MFLIAMVARIFRPGCKADAMLVLEGRQGIGKSTAVRVLASDEWFSDSLPDIRTKDAQHHLRGKWVIEVPELAATDKANAAQLKSFVSRAKEIFRAVYERNDAHDARQCVFVGTTNQERYLRDDSGARRFWPVRVCEAADIDITSLRRDRDQLFAEAVARYRSDERWWPDDHAFENEHIKPEREQRFEVDAWEDPVCAYLEQRDRVSVQEVLTKVLGLKIGEIGTTQERRVSSILKRQGWIAGRGFKGRFYARPGSRDHDACRT
jgi:predicted P-loop ATPase